MKSGFTLIELLIVVLIIAILAAIAVPNFLEFQMRAKVARVKADLRTFEVAIQAYAVDEGCFPIIGSPQASSQLALPGLTTPIAYLSSIPPDPFRSSYRYYAWGPPYDDDYVWHYYAQTGSAVPLTWGDAAFNSWGWNSFDTALLYSDGPSEQATAMYYWLPNYLQNDAIEDLNKCIYDPTNGTISFGAAYRVIGDTRGFGSTNP